MPRQGGIEPPQVNATDERSSSSLAHHPRTSQIIRWAAVFAVAAFCLYRLAVFKPQPIDSPGTLRPILYSLFRWFVGIYQDPIDAFNLWVTGCAVVFLLPAAFAVLNYGWKQKLIRLPRRGAQVLCSRWLFSASLALCLILCRYPTLLENEFNPDEGQFLASAHKLFYDPNFFHAVDCGTSGPINIYPLMLPAILGFSPDFASSRVIVLIIILLCALLLHRSITLVASDDLARIAVLPFIGAFAVFRSPELIHYSSEHVPLLLISIAMYLSVRIFCDPARYRVRLFLLGMLSSAGFLAKMQSVPIIAAIAVLSLASVCFGGQRGRPWLPILLLAAGTAPLLLINAIWCVSTGVWPDFWMSYIRVNLGYGAVDTSFVTNLRGFVQFMLTPAELVYFLYIVVAMGAAYLIERMRRRITSEHSAFVQLAVVSCLIASAIVMPAVDRLTIFTFLALLAICIGFMYFAVLFATENVSGDPVRWFGFLAQTSVAASLFSIYRPHHAFVHYLLLLFVPLCALVGWMLVRQAEECPEQGRDPRRIAFVAFTVVLTVAYQNYLWSFQDDHVFKYVTREIRAPEGELIVSLTHPGGRIFVWGWTVRPFLASGRVSATRDGNVSACFRSYNLMTSPPVSDQRPALKVVEAYYQARILRGLRADPPELFIDAVGPASWFLTDRKYYGFEQFPGIAGYLSQHYVRLPDAFGERFYLRSDLAEKARSVPQPPQQVRSPPVCRLSDGTGTSQETSRPLTNQTRQPSSFPLPANRWSHHG